MSSRDDFIGWVRDHSHHVAGTEFDSPDSDFEPLREIVGDAHIVGIGESMHCVREFQMARFRMTKYLIERLGFTAVLFEGLLSSDLSMDDFVNERGPEPVLSGVNDSIETRQFLEWIRKHNATAAEPVRVFGGDVSPKQIKAFEALVSYFEQADPAYSVPHLESARETAADFAAADSGSRRVARSVGEELAGRLLSRAAEYTHATSPEAYKWALHRATVALRSLVAVEFGGAQREVAIAENTKWITDFLGSDSRVVLLCAVSHVGRNLRPNLAKPQAPPYGAGGYYLGEWCGSDYRTIEVTFGDNGDFDLLHPQTKTKFVGPAQPDSIDQALQEAGGGISLIDLRAAGDQAWLSEPRPHRTVEAFDYHLDLRFPEAFDAVLHVPSQLHVTPPLPS